MTDTSIPMPIGYALPAGIGYVDPGTGLANAQTSYNNTTASNAYNQGVSNYGQNVYSGITSPLTQDPAHYAAIGAAYGRAAGNTPGSTNLYGATVGGGVGSGSVFDTGTSPVPYPGIGGLPAPTPVPTPAPAPPPPPPSAQPSAGYDPYAGASYAPQPNTPLPMPDMQKLLGYTPQQWQPSDYPAPAPPSGPINYDTDIPSGMTSGNFTNLPDNFASRFQFPSPSPDELPSAYAGGTVTGGGSASASAGDGGGGGSYTFSDPTAPPAPPPNIPSIATQGYPDMQRLLGYTPQDLPPAGGSVTGGGSASQGVSNAPAYSPPSFASHYPSDLPPSYDTNQQLPPGYEGLQGTRDIIARAIMQQQQQPPPSQDTLTPSDLGIPFGGGVGGIMNQGADYSPFNDPAYFPGTDMRDFQSPANDYGTFQQYPQASTSTSPPGQVVGTASTYDPTKPGWQTGGMETKSGQTYDPNAFTAAIQSSLQNQFGGVKYGQPPTSGLVEGPGGQQAIVGVNDVGPLTQGRVMDLSTATMKYFNPASSPNSGVVPNMQITPYYGSAPPGPVGPVGPTGPMQPTPGVPLPNMLGPTLPYTPTTGFVRR